MKLSKIELFDIPDVLEQACRYITIALRTKTFYIKNYKSQIAVAFISVFCDHLYFEF